MLSLSLLKKVQNKSPQKGYRPKTFAHSNKSQRLHFSVTYLLITFSHQFFEIFSTDSKSASNSELFYTHIAFRYSVFAVQSLEYSSFRRDKLDCDQCRFCCSLPICAIKSSQGIVLLFQQIFSRCFNICIINRKYSLLVPLLLKEQNFILITGVQNLGLGTLDEKDQANKLSATGTIIDIQD